MTKNQKQRMGNMLAKMWFGKDGHCIVYKHGICIEDCDTIKDKGFKTTKIYHGDTIAQLIEVHQDDLYDSN